MSYSMSQGVFDLVFTGQGCTDLALRLATDIAVFKAWRPPPPPNLTTHFRFLSPDAVSSAVGSAGRVAFIVAYGLVFVNVVIGMSTVLVRPREAGRQRDRMRPGAPFLVFVPPSQVRLSPICVFCAYSLIVLPP